MENADGELEGISVWAWEKIAEDLNLKFRYEKRDLEEIITGLKNGSIDMSMNPLTVTAQRSQAIDFSHPFFVSNSTVAIPETSTLQKGLQFITSFFSLNFFRSILALFVVILIFGLLAWFFERKANPEEFQTGVKGIWSGIWWSAVTMTTVGYGDKSPKSLGGRIVALVWMFTAIIIISGFTAGIASSLTVNQLGWSKNSISDFKKERIATVANSATAHWLERHFFRRHEVFPTLPEALQALNENRVSGVTYDEPILKYLVNNDERFSSMEMLPIKFNPQFYSFGFSIALDEKLKYKISKKIIELTEGSDWKNLLAEYDLQDM